MRERHYSGIQGLCVSLARFVPGYDGSALFQANIARELFNDISRFDNAYSVSRTWRLAPARRRKMFEESWGKAARDLRADMAARAAAVRGAGAAASGPEGQGASRPGSAPHGAGIAGAAAAPRPGSMPAGAAPEPAKAPSGGFGVAPALADFGDCAHLLTPDGRVRSFSDAPDRFCVEACVRALCSGEDECLVRTAFLSLGADAARVLREAVVPAMAQGFSVERYSAMRVRAFSDDMEALVRERSGGAPCDMLAVMRRLVAAAVYGPEHPLAIAASAPATDMGAAEGPGWLSSDASRIAITHIYDAGAAVVGAHERFDADATVFIGRSSTLERYRQRAAACDVPADEGAYAEIFHIPDAHRRVSGCHGVLFCRDGSWFYADLDSTNGTMVRGVDGDAQAVAACALRPGDVLLLGAPAGGCEGDAYRRGAALLVSAEMEGGMASAPDDAGDAAGADGSGRLR